MGEAAFLSSWHDDTPEGRSIIRLAYERGFIPREINDTGSRRILRVFRDDQNQRSETENRLEFHVAQSGERRQGVDTGGNMQTRRLAEFVDYNLDSSAKPESDSIEILKGAPDSIRKIALSVPPNFQSAN